MRKDYLCDKMILFDSNIKSMKTLKQSKSSCKTILVRNKRVSGTDVLL